MNIHFIIHESFESPAAIKQWAIANKHTISETLVYKYQKLPNEISDIDLLIIMGGPQSPNTSVEECPYFNASEEILFIQKAIKNGKAVLGVCLGSQLVGEALGAPVEHSPHKEIGIYPITFTHHSKNDELFESLPEVIDVAHWHGDMPGLTENAVILAYSEGCPRQIIKFAPLVYGFQCHFEFTSESIITMIENGLSEFDDTNKLPYVCDAEFLKKYDFTLINQYLFIFLNRMEQHILQVKPRH